MSTGVILGSAFEAPTLGGVALRPERVETRFGEATLFRWSGGEREGWVVFRHGVPHRYLPHQIPYRAAAAALRAAGCRALLVTSSVGVLDPSVPLDVPLVLSDLIVLENRLPDGSACSMFPEPGDRQGHLVLDEGLFSGALSEQVEAMIADLGWPVSERVVFGYVMGPRTKTAAENRMWAGLGAQVNSMTVAPEVELANELEIPTAGLVIGHKHSRPGDRTRLSYQSIDDALRTGREAFERLAVRFLEKARPVPFGNRIYRYGRKDREGRAE